MDSRVRKLLPLVIFAGFVVVALLVWLNPPKGAERVQTSGPLMSVEVQNVAQADYTVMLESYGTVQPRTQSALVAQVGGEIVFVDDSFREGGFFEQGDLLARIDSRDYAADVRIAEATLLDAKQALAEADARTSQAQEDWQRLGNTSEAPDLVLRIPQLEAAKAKVISAESALQKAQLDLERTRIVAPFSGRILSKFVDVGQVVSPNAQLAEIYSTDSVEIRLPLRNRDLPFIDLPEARRFEEAPETNTRGTVEIQSTLGGPESWRADLVRTESAIDDTARQLHVIAQISDPFGPDNAAKTPLKIGQYVTATIEGKTMADAIVIPNTTIYQGSYVYLVKDDVLERRDIDIVWQNAQEALIASGLEPGDRLVTTPLGQVTSGLRVTALDAASSDSPQGAQGAEWAAER